MGILGLIVAHDPRWPQFGGRGLESHWPTAELESRVLQFTDRQTRDGRATRNQTAIETYTAGDTNTEIAFVGPRASTLAKKWPFSGGRWPDS